MARTSALNIKLENGSTAADLAEIQGGVIGNVMKGAVSVALKSQNFSGNPKAGSVEYKRFENAVSAAYGTARTALAGVALQTKPVVVNIDQHREIIEEFKAFDIATYGVPGLLARRAANHAEGMIRELDTAFFATAYATGAAVSHSASTTKGKLEELILAVETVSNSFVDGVDRNDIAVVLSPAWASALRLEIDALPATDNTVANGLIGKFHGVDIYTSNRMPKGVGQVVDAVAMRYDSMGQPVVIADAYADEKIPLSNDHAVELFYDYATDALCPDLVFYSGNAYSAS